MPVMPQQLCEWALANALNQKFQIEAAVANKQLGTTSISPIPFGSTVTINQPPPAPAPTSTLGSLAQKALVGLALGGGGLGAGLYLAQPKPSPPPPAAVQEIPLSIDYSFEPTQEKGPQ